MKATLASGASIELPPATVTVIQDEAEATRTPGFDLRVIFDDGDALWPLEYRTTSSAPFAAWSPTETVVFGFNAIHESVGVREALDAERPIANALILHQLGPDRLQFLRDDLAVELRRVPGSRGWETEAAHGLVTEDELLLNWPHAGVEVPTDADAINWLSFSPQSAWRVVLEVSNGSRRLPVLVRTGVTFPQRLVVCTLRLQRAHRALLENMLTYCAFGRPEVAVVDLGVPHGKPSSEKAYDGPTLTGSLRLQGTRAVLVKPKGGKVELGRWPLKGAENVVLPDDFEFRLPHDGPDRRWLDAGGTVVQYDTDGRLTFRTSATASHWAALRWMTWYAGTEPASWLESIFASRAVLRMLDEMSKRHPGNREIGDPSDHAKGIALLLGRRVRGGNCEETVSTTAAAWELNELVGRRALSPYTARRMKAWLLEQARDLETTVEDRLEVARALGRPDVLDAVLTQHLDGAPPNATVVTRLREAMLKCHTGEKDLSEATRERLATWVAGPEVEATLERRPLVAAGYLNALIALHGKWSWHPLAAPEGPDVRAALDALVSRGWLARLGEGASGTAEEISTEALAHVRYLDGRRLVAPINARTARVPDQLLPSVIEEVNRAHDAEAAGQQRWRALATAIPVLGALALTAILVGLADIVNALGIRLQLGLYPPIVLAVLLGGFCAFRWWRRRRLGIVPVKNGDLALTQGIVGMAALLASAAAILGVLDDQGWSLPLLAAALFVGLVFGVLSLLLSPYDLVPGWASKLIPMLFTPAESAKRIVEGLRRK